VNGSNAAAAARAVRYAGRRRNVDHEASVIDFRREDAGLLQSKDLSE